MPSDESEELFDASAHHLASLNGPSVLREALKGGDVSPTIWQEIVDYGYASIGLPEELGGLGTITQLSGVLERAGAALVPAPLMVTAAAKQTLQSLDMSLDALGPEDIVGLALDLQDHSSSSGITVLHGDDIGMLVLVSAERDKVVSRLYSVTHPGAGREQDTIDPTRPLVRLNRSQLTLVAEYTSKTLTIDSVLAVARLCVASDLVGIAQKALTLAVDFAKTREQFGQPIGGFQAIKHMLADSYVRLERARALTLGGTVSADGDRSSPETTRLSVLAKAAASEAVTKNCAVLVQVFGAMGLTFEADPQLYVRRASATSRFLGDSRDLYLSAARAFRRTESHHV